MARKKSEEEKKSIPVIVRLSKEENEILEKRASILGMNVSAFLRLLIRRKIELEERKHKTQDKEVISR
jgi:predicted HTH domain antitoxin